MLSIHNKVDSFAFHLYEILRKCIVIVVTIWV